MAFKMKSPLPFINDPNTDLKSVGKAVLNPAAALANKAGFGPNTTLGKILDPMSMVMNRDKKK